jgi:hypothetical protein
VGEMKGIIMWTSIKMNISFTAFWCVSAAEGSETNIHFFSEAWKTSANSETI